MPIISEKQLLAAPRCSEEKERLRIILTRESAYADGLEGFTSSGALNFILAVFAEEFSAHGAYPIVFP